MADEERDYWEWAIETAEGIGTEIRDMSEKIEEEDSDVTFEMMVATGIGSVVLLADIVGELVKEVQRLSDA